MTSHTINRNGNSKTLGKRILDHRDLYLLILPAFIITVIFKYVPLYGIQLAFKNMKLGQTITTAKWIGLDNFQRFFSTGAFSRTLVNTLMVGILNLLTFPLPIILALLLNNCEVKFIKKSVQTITYIPNLISVAVTMSIVILFCSNSTGFINILFKNLGIESIPFMSKDKFVRPMYIISGIWSATGYNAVIYLAALSSVNPELIDAAKIDGCSKLQRIWYVEVPKIAPTIAILLIMSMGSFFSASTEKMLMIQTDLNLGASEIIGTYTYKIGILKRQYGYSAAVDLFTNVVNFTMLILANFISKKVSDSSLF
ncbi:MAG: sugar ABC transporter permease [Lachnospiraceae bacterium]|nr:sugar ABC transporter permease [Candidatus Colinaster equi]